MPEEIISTADIDDLCGEEGPDSNLVAVRGPTSPPHPIEFTVQMRGHTMNDMETLIVHAAATQLLGSRDKTKLAKEIEAACQSLILSKVNAGLAKITDAIIDQPLTPTSWGDKKPMTMREAINLTPSAYLSQKVDRDGKPTSSGAYSSAWGTMLEWIVWQNVSAKFKHELQATTNQAVRTVELEIKARHAAMIEEEKKRFREALSKLTA